MKKKHKEYEEKYGHVPNGFQERVNYMINELRLGVKEISKLKESIEKIRQYTVWKEIDFVFYFIPEAAPRPKYSGKMGSFYVKGAKVDRTEFKQYLVDNNTLYELITTPCHFYCDFFLPIPNDMNRIEKVLAELRLIKPVATPDWDNVGKKYSDMVQGELLLNDSLIVHAQVRKFYSVKPRLELHFSYKEKYDSKYNKRKVESWTSYKSHEENIDKDSII
jgi:Holliday junction resolvase RusA-like endonuclease